LAYTILQPKAVGSGEQEQEQEQGVKFSKKSGSGRVSRAFFI
jgi:hypothetical protein